MARQVQEDSRIEPKRAVPATEQQSSSDDEITAADKALAAMGYAPVSGLAAVVEDIIHPSYTQQNTGN
jgi:hypothetical protein